MSISLSEFFESHVMHLDDLDRVMVLDDKKYHLREIEESLNSKDTTAYDDLMSHVKQAENAHEDNAEMFPWWYIQIDDERVPENEFFEDGYTVGFYADAEFNLINLFILMVKLYEDALNDACPSNRYY